jgi:hypothetical protein
MRLEFWSGWDEPGPGKLSGSAWCENAYLAASRPHQDELVSTDFVTSFGRLAQPGTPEAICHAHLLRAVPVPFMPVFAIEHYVVPVLLADPDESPAVQVIFRLRAPGSQETRDALTIALSAAGWTVTGLADEKEAAARIFGPQSGR